MALFGTQNSQVLQLPFPLSNISGQEHCDMHTAIAQRPAKGKRSRKQTKHDTPMLLEQRTTSSDSSEPVGACKMYPEGTYLGFPELLILD